jgi:hypothetical protein
MHFDKLKRKVEDYSWIAVKFKLVKELASVHYITKKERKKRTLQNENTY